MIIKISQVTMHAVSASERWSRSLCYFLVLVFLAMFAIAAGHASDVSLPSGTIAIDTYNNLAATADRTGFVQLFDITAPDHPVLLSKFTVPKELNGIALAGDSLLVSGQGGVQILDISNPAAPEFRTEVDLGADATVVRAAGNLGYAASGTTVVLFNIANGEILDRHSYSELEVNDLAVSTDNLYVLSADADSPGGYELVKVQIEASLGQPIASFRSGESGRSAPAIYRSLLRAA